MVRHVRTSSQVLARPRGVSAPPGPLVSLTQQYPLLLRIRNYHLRMADLVDPEDLLDSSGVAEMMGPRGRAPSAFIGAATRTSRSPCRPRALRTVGPPRCRSIVGAPTLDEA